MGPGIVPELKRRRARIFENFSAGGEQQEEFFGAAETWRHRVVRVRKKHGFGLSGNIVTQSDVMDVVLHNLRQ